MYNMSEQYKTGFGFDGGVWDVIVFIPDHCLSIYFTDNMTGTFALPPISKQVFGNLSEGSGLASFCQIGNIFAAYANLSIMLFQNIRYALFEKNVEECE